MESLKNVGTVAHTHRFLKNSKKEIIKLIIFLLILFICLGIIFKITKRKEAYMKSEDFLKQEENFDVLFLGSSHVYRTVYPMQLWDDYGIISYNMGQTSATICITYYNLLLACQETNPKLVVIDTYKADSNEKISENNYSNSMHNTFDAYPISYKKYLAIRDLCGSENLLDNEIEFLFNFSIYHSRWSELEKKDFTNSYNEYIKGAVINTSVETIESENLDFDSIEAYSEEESINMIYLRKIIEYCQGNDIDVLITYNPSESDENEIAVSKYIQVICDEYKVNYINFYEKGIIDDSIDFNDDDHLNQSGARKVTDYLGNYIMENYDIQDQRENESYSFWYEDYDKYIDLKINNLKSNRSDLNNYLMLLYGEEDISYEIKVSSELEIQEDSTLEALLENLENNYEIDDDAFYEENEETGELEKLDKTIKITTWDNRTGEEINTVWFEE